MSIVRSAVRRVMKVVDDWYSRRYRLQPLGPVLLLGRGRYRGPDLQFEDGTSLRDNEPIGRLHFNNSSIVALGEGSMHQTGFRFARLMRLSLLRLAECARSNPDYSDVRVFEGITWIPQHGEVVGFISKPLPPSLRTLWLIMHFKLLSWAFAPTEKIRDAARAKPRVYWLTRAALQQNLGKLAKTVE